MLYIVSKLLKRSKLTGYGVQVEIRYNSKYIAYYICICCKLGGDDGEFGATTGRARRMGWFDCVASKYGCMLQGTTDIAFSLIDVLGYLDKIPVCVAYEIDGVSTTVFPNTVELNRAKPILEYVDGWKCDLQGISKYEDLPAQARAYIEFVEERLGYPITMISNGPKREDIIYR